MSNNMIKAMLAFVPLAMAHNHAIVKKMTPEKIYAADASPTHKIKMDVNDTLKIKMCLPPSASGNWHAEKPVGTEDYYNLTETHNCDSDSCHYEWTIDPIETTYDLRADIDTSIVFLAPNGDDLEMKLNIKAPEDAFYACDTQDSTDISTYYLNMLGELEGSVNKCQTRMSDYGEQQYFLALLMAPDD